MSYPKPSKNGNLKTIDRKLNEISSRINFYAVNPINEKEEMERFFSEPGYNPQFRYSEYGEDLGAIRKELMKLRPDSSPVGKLLRQIRDNYIMDTVFLDNRGKEGFTEASARLYGIPDEVLVKKARMLLRLKTEKEKKAYTTKQIISHLERAFMKYGFDWKIEEKEMIANAAVTVDKKVLMIKKDSRFSKNFLKRIVVHEIGTHVLRAENGRMQPYLFFSRGLPGYLMTEEGLAVINEERNNCLNNYVLKIYAGRVLAIDKALKGSFYETYSYLKKHFGKKTSWRLAVRAKRGLSDTGKPGACTKDIAYLQGYIAIREYLKKGGDIHKLYYGKVGLQHVDILQKIPHLVHPVFLPMFRYTNFFFRHFSSFFRDIVFLDDIPRI